MLNQREYLKDRHALYVNPSQGNEPYKLGVEIALETAKQLQQAGTAKPVVVVPNFYGKRQEQILKEEFPDSVGDIYLDDTTGEILSPLLFGKAGYNAHLNALVDLYPTISETINDRFGHNFEFSVRSLSGNQSISISGENILASVDTGSKVLLPVLNRYYCFPTLLSELLKETRRYQVEGEYDFGFNESHMKQVEVRMEELEAQYNRIFIPQLTTLSFLKDYPYQAYVTEYKDKTLTPPLVRRLGRTSGQIEKEGIYVMYSGTEVDRDANETTFEMAWNADLEVYLPPWVDMPDVMTEGYDYFKASPSVIVDKKIVAVAGRAGMGTGWKAQYLGKPWFVHKYIPDDDPEMYFNAKMVEFFQMGEIVDPEEGPNWRNLDRRLIGYELVSKTHINEFQRTVFPTSDGIGYVASKIVQNILS